MSEQGDFIGVAKARGHMCMRRDGGVELLATLPPEPWVEYERVGHATAVIVWRPEATSREAGLSGYFTWEDVDVLRDAHVARAIPGYGEWATDDRATTRLRSLADRIAALLPPREKP